MQRRPRRTPSLAPVRLRRRRRRLPHRLRARARSAAARSSSALQRSSRSASGSIIAASVAVAGGAASSARRFTPSASHSARPRSSSAIFATAVADAARRGQPAASSRPMPPGHRDRGRISPTARRPTGIVAFGAGLRRRRHDRRVRDVPDIDRAFVAVRRRAAVRDVARSGRSRSPGALDRVVAAPAARRIG